MSGGLRAEGGRLLRLPLGRAPARSGRGTEIIARKNVRKWVSAARFRVEDKVLQSGKGVSPYMEIVNAVAGTAKE